MTFANKINQPNILGALKIFLISFFVFLLTSWVFITPPGSGIDDDFHLPSIWCGQGEMSGTCALGKKGDLLGLVPEYVANAPFCIGYQPFESGACTQDTELTSELVGARINELGLYMPNGYYFINSWFISSDFNNSIWLMRSFNLVIFSLLIILAAFSSSMKNKLLLGWLVIANFNPMFFSVITSNNNSSWFFAAIIFFFFFLYNLSFSTENKDKLISVIGILLIFLLALNSRTDNLPLLIIMIVFFGLVLAKGKWLYGYLATLAVGIGVVILRGQLPGIGGFGLSSAFGSIDPRRDAADVFTHNLIRLPSFLNGLLGGWGINWLDFRFPTLVTTALQVSILFFIFLTYRQFNKFFVVGLIGLIGTFGIYFWILQIDLNLIGEMVQPRYLYPLFAFSLGFFVFSSANLLNLSNWKIYLLAALFTLGNSGALYFTIRRYITGVDIRYWNLDELIEWWQLPGTPMLFWVFWSISLVFIIIGYSFFSKKVLSNLTPIN